jgi:hypothetical protein
LLWEGISGTKPAPEPCPNDFDTLTGLMNKWGDITKAEKTAQTYYDTACCHVELRNYNKALEDLASATVDPKYKVWARTDASFAELRNPYNLEESNRRNLPAECQIATFYAQIGDPCPASFTALAPFSKHEEILRGIGVRSPKDLAHMTETRHDVIQLAKDFALPELEIRRWRNIAMLGSVVCADTRPTDEHYYQELLAPSPCY